MRRRLLLSYLALSLVVLVLLEIPLAVTYARSERQSLLDRVERDAVAMATLAEDALEGGDPVTAQIRRTAMLYRAETGGRVIVVDAGGRAQLDTDPSGSTSFASRPEIVAALRGDIATGRRHSDTLGGDILYVAVPVASGGTVHGAARITYPMAAVNDRIHRYWLVLAGIAGIVLLAAGAVALALTRWTTRPLSTLELAAVQVGAGDLAARAPVGGPPELRRLASTFNTMAGKLDQLLRSQDDFVADASHQLRTPLAALRLRLENLERDVPPTAASDLQGALVEVERLAGLVEGLLALARADRAPTAPEPIEVAPLADERVAAWQALADERGVFLTALHTGPSSALITPGRLEQVLDNLLANALEASPAGSTIRVRIAGGPGGVTVGVADEGPGMTERQRARAFDRFWRTGDGDGFGLGLPIVRRLVESDGGTVELRDAAPRGLEAVVRLLPASAAHDGRGCPRPEAAAREERSGAA